MIPPREKPDPELWNALAVVLAFTFGPIIVLLIFAWLGGCGAAELEAPSDAGRGDCPDTVRECVPREAGRE